MTIKELAALAEVSVATVSYVINDSKKVSEKTKRKVLDAIIKSGYKPNHIAKSLRVKSTKVIGVLVEDILGFPVPKIINGISEYAEQLGYQILLSDLRMLDKLYNQYSHIVEYKDKIQNAIQFLLQSAQVDGIIYVSMFDRDITGIIDDIGSSLVFAYCTTQNEKSGYVTYDSEQASYNIMKCLIENGHREIGIITGLQNTFPSRMRMQGIRRALKEFHITMPLSHIRFGDWEYESGYRCAVELMNSNSDMTAIFSMNDLMAVGAANAMAERGRKTPEHISIVGFDNREIAALTKLTTVEIDLKGIGRESAKMLIDQIKGIPIETREKILSSKLIMRDTVKNINLTKS